MKQKIISLCLSLLVCLALTSQTNNVETYPDYYLFGDGIPNSNWGVPPVNPMMFVNNGDGTYTVMVNTAGGYFAIVHEDAMNCADNDWTCLNALRTGPSEDGTNISNTTVPISMAEGAFRIDPGTYNIHMDKNGNTITATSLASLEKVEHNKLEIYAVDGTIVLPDEVNYTIIDILGRDVTSKNGHLKGVYLVQVNNNTYKVIVK